MELPIDGRANRAIRRMAEQKAKDELKHNLHTIAILVREENGQTVYQWGGNTGVWLSPPLPDKHVAFRYPLDVGLKPQDAQEL